MPTFELPSAAQPGFEVTPSDGQRFTRALVALTRAIWHPDCSFDSALALICETAADALRVERVNAWHYDRGAQRLRTDLSFTLFLTPPGEYEGGELVIHAAGMTQVLKGEAGNLVLYPSGSIHEVKPVTKGTRIVCIGWIESTVADPAQREMLFDLENLRTALRQQLPAQSAELLTLDKTIANLLRMWARS